MVRSKVDSKLYIFELYISELFRRAQSGIKVFISLVIVLIGVHIQVAHGDRRVGLVDVQKVIDASRVGRQAKEEVERMVKQEQVKMQALTKELEVTKAAFVKQATLLSGKALEEKQASLRQREKQVTRAIQDKKYEIVAKNREEISGLVAKIDRVSQEIGKEMGLTLVFESDPSFVLYSNNDLDITNQVIAALDARSW